MTTSTAAQAELIWLDPRELLAHTRNPRADLGDLTELTDSIRTTGVLEPLVIVPAGDGYYSILAGHRRAAAAIDAGAVAVACLIRPDLAADDEDSLGQARHIGTMLQENLLREGLTATEEANAVQQMLDLGMGVGDVTASTGLARKRVVKGAAVARLDSESQRMIDDAQLPLDMAAAVSEFAGDGEAIAGLIDAGTRGSGQFAHQLERARRQKKANAEYQAKLDELTAAGVAWVDTVNHHGPTNRGLSQLAAGPQRQGPVTALTPEEHAACPGHAANVRINYSDEVQVTYVCTRPFEHGHIERYASSSPSTRTPVAELSEEEREKAKEARRELIENNKAMDAANAVRREWLRGYLAGKAPKSLLRFSVEALTRYPHLISGWFGYGSALESLAETPLRGMVDRPYGTSYGVKPPPTSLTTGAPVPDARLTMQLFAHVAGAFEQSIRRDSWRDGNAHHAAWLRLLESLGYVLADVEHNLIGIADGKADDWAASHPADSGELEETPAADGYFCVLHGEDCDGHDAEEDQ